MQTMKRLTTPILKLLLLISLILLLGLFAFNYAASTKDGLGNLSEPGLTIVVPAYALLLTALAAFTVLVWRFTKRIGAWRLMKRIGAQKLILLCGAVVFVFCGLFPPWLYISYQGHTRSAGYSFILSPPPNEYGTRLDLSRLTVEWACNLAATAAGWMIFIPRKPAKEQKKEKNDPLSLN